MAAKKKVSKKRVAKKRIIKKRAAKKKVSKKRTVRRANPIYKEHIVIAQLRPDKAKEATRKRLPVVNRLYFDGAGWNENKMNAARFRSRAHALSIAKLVVESKIHNNKLRQIAVTEAAETRGQGELRSKRGSPGGKQKGAA